MSDEHYLKIIGEQKEKIKSLETSLENLRVKYAELKKFYDSHFKAPTPEEFDEWLDCNNDECG
jgi:hypothetical protein